MMNSRSELRMRRGVLDTCVVIDLHDIPAQALPHEMTVSTVTLAELSMGVHLAKDAEARSLRLTHLVVAEANFAPLPFDENAVHVFGSLVALVVALGRNPKPRKSDLMIAATAVANGLPLYTRNVDDFKGMESQLTVVGI